MLQPSFLRQKTYQTQSEFYDTKLTWLKNNMFLRKIKSIFKRSKSVSFNLNLLKWSGNEYQIHISGLFLYYQDLSDIEKRKNHQRWNSFQDKADIFYELLIQVSRSNFQGKKHIRFNLERWTKEELILNLTNVLMELGNLSKEKKNSVFKFKDRSELLNDLVRQLKTQECQ